VRGTSFLPSQVYSLLLASVSIEHRATKLYALTPTTTAGGKKGSLALVVGFGIFGSLKKALEWRFWLTTEMIDV
jgi:hypothetical protein